MNMVIAPFLIFGWGTGHAYGVAGAAISTLIAVIVGVIWLSTYFVKPDAYLRFHFHDWMPQFGLWKRMLAIGLPTGFEFAMMAAYQALVYTLARPFGAAAQAAFGIGMRLIQAGFMPVVALGFSVAPVAGQNFGARMPDRVKATFKDAATMAGVYMLLLAVLTNLAPEAQVRVFSKDPQAIAAGAEYLRIISWNYVASGLIFVASSMFQAMGNTMPSLFASAVRITLIAVPAILLSRLPTFQLHWIWYLSVASVFVQLTVAMLLLRREFRKRMSWGVAAPPASPLTGSREAVGGRV
jgi:putative MATE family efflux protein